MFFFGHFFSPFRGLKAFRVIDGSSVLRISREDSGKQETGGSYEYWPEVASPRDLFLKIGKKVENNCDNEASQK